MGEKRRGAGEKGTHRPAGRLAETSPKTLNITTESFQIKWLHIEACIPGERVS